MARLPTCSAQSFNVSDFIYGMPSRLFGHLRSLRISPNRTGPVHDKGRRKLFNVVVKVQRNKHADFQRTPVNPFLPRELAVIGHTHPLTD